MKLFGVRRPQADFVESFRFLANNVREAAQEHQVYALLIMSAYSRDGRTTTTLNLAAALAEGGDRVLVVDADLRRPKLANLLETESDETVQSVLARMTKEQGGTLPLQGAATSIEGVRLLPASRLEKNDAVPPLRDLMAILPPSDQARFVIFDSPPCEDFADAFQLAPVVDDVIYVIKRRRQDKALHQRIRKQLESVNASLSGVVFNEG